ncbi:MAG: pyridoxal phosphate-dependent aminotransferase [Candidatus Yonathbacteria bacterium]|nr:pyridoxal phosphate-dependent aminotransferase [Candidatus Yonathbacteria bacterium]
MRTNIVHEGADELTYEIRGIVAFADKLAKLGVPIVWENIGDPIAKGETVAPWIKEIIAEYTRNDVCFGYTPTKGVLSARQFIASERKRESHITLDPENVLFFNGLGDAISILYTYLRKSARVIGPSPAYSTHSSAEAAHAGASHITYALDPHRNWLPDVEDLRNKVRYNPSVAGILIINPDNPTGMVYPRKVLEQIVDIARTYGLFLIADETYARLAYNPKEFTPLYEVIGDDVPTIVMRGLSKEIPWPGSRCGWIEVYNKDVDAGFARYIKTLNDAKMLEVCATALPQHTLPAILGDVRYDAHVKERTARYAERATRAYKAFTDLSGVMAPRPEGAFYYSVVFDDFPANGTLPIADQRVRAEVEQAVLGVPADKRFVYYLLGATGIVVVPLSGFNSDLVGFRMTLLEIDDTRFDDTIARIAEAVATYRRSAMA